MDRTRAVQAEQPLSREGEFQLVLQHRYLLLIGLVTLIIQLVNTNGNFIFDSTLREMAEAAVAAGTAGGLSVRDLGRQLQCRARFLSERARRDPAVFRSVENPRSPWA